jgi:hypothetical protein
MLLPMQQPVPSEASGDRSRPPGWTPESSSTPRSFAGLLAALTAPASTAANRAPAWNDDGLGDDVATLSYESALRAHARYKPSGTGNWPFSQASDAKPLPDDKPPSGEGISSAVKPASPVAPDWSGGEEAVAVRKLSAALEQTRKRTSITIRLSKAECAQLRTRAAEAGLTVSAYLRSCTIEAEALRAQVKEALAGLRSATAAERRVAPPRHRWWLRIWPHPRPRAPRP